MGNIQKLKADHSKCSYNLIANEILLNKMADETRVSLAAKGLFWQIMNLPDDWELTESGLATITGESEYKIKTLLKELNTWGYVTHKMLQNEKGIFTRKLFIIREVLNSPVTGKSSDWESKSVGTTAVDIQSVENQSGGFLSQYNNILNNNIIINNDLENNDLKNNYENFSKEKLFEQKPLPKNNYSMDPIHVSQNSETSSFRIPNITKQDTALDNNQDKIKSIMTVTDPKNEIHEKPRRGGDRIKNVVQKMEMEKGDTIKTVDTQVAHTMNELTAEDNKLSNVIRMANELESMNKSINKSNMKKLGNKKQMQKYAEKLIPDVEICDKFKDYLDVKIEKTGPMSKKSVDLLVEDLYHKSNNNKSLMLCMLREATKLGWGDLYINDTIEKQAAEFNTVQKTGENNTVESNEDDYEVIDLFDENGNKIKF